MYYETNFLHKLLLTDTKVSMLPKSSGVLLINNKIRDTMKVIKSLENRGTLRNKTTGKDISQEGGLLNFLAH